jgi:hypothetical protein
MPWEVGIERTSDGVSAAGAPIVIMIIHVVASQTSLTLFRAGRGRQRLSVGPIPIIGGQQKIQSTYDPFIVKTQTSPSESNE